MAVHLIVRIALPSTAEKIFLAVSAITRDWTILVARGNMWCSWTLADYRVTARAHVLLPLVPIIKGTAKVVKQDIPDSAVESPRSLAD